ncbi:unnamed protein product [Sphagnum balticum]
MIKQFFGISAYWIDLQLWIRYKLALGLAVPDGHNAQTCNDAAMAVLKRYGIRRSDIVLSINDTTNTSLATSRLIVGTDGTCNMHLANLACDHATGKRKRTVKKGDCRLIRRMRGPAPSRASNDQALRCKWTLHQYFAHEKSLVCNAYELSNERWQSVAEVEATIRLVWALSFTTQIDSRLVATEYKDNVDNAKELFKSALVDEATRSFRPPEPNAMCNVPLDDDDIDVQVCDDDDVFDMVNVGSPSQDIESRASVALNTATPSDLANEDFKEWILLKNLGNAKFEMLLILAFNKAFIKDMEIKDLFAVDNLIASLKSATDATKAAANIIKYFDLDGDVKDDETDEGMEIVTMLKSAACDIQQQHDANGSAIAQKRARNE